MSVLYSVILTGLAIGVLHRALVARAASRVLAFAICLNLFLVSAWYLIDSFTGNGIDQSVLYFLQSGLSGAPLSEFMPFVLPVLAAVVALVAVTYAAYRSALAKTPPKAARPRILAGSAALALAFVVNPSLPDIATLARRAAPIFQSGETLVEVPANYVAVDAIAFDKPPKSFIYLYVESYEQTFLDETLFPGLTPNLVELRQQALAFTDISQVPGTTYTIAGQVASQCGVPLSAAGTGSDRYLPGATCLGDLLAGQGYVLGYMDGATSSFAGTETYYRTHAFHSVEGVEDLQDELPDPDTMSSWGLYDDSLLELAKERIAALAAQDQPFGFFIQTSDTHHPQGNHIPPSCADLRYLDGSNTYLNSIHCADRLAGDFIRHVLTSPDLADTVLVVGSDHLSRPNMATDILDKGVRRNLLMMFGRDIPPGINDKPGNTLDAGPTLLSLIGAQTPALAYGRNLLAAEPTLRDRTAGDILDTDNAFLMSMWSFPHLGGGIMLDAANNRLRLGDRTVGLPVLLHLKDDYSVQSIDYQTGSETPPIELAGDLAFDAPFILADRCNRASLFVRGAEMDPARTCALVGRLGSPALVSFVLEDGQRLPFEVMLPHLQDVPANADLFDQNIEGWKRGISFVDAQVVDYRPPTGLVGQAMIRSAGYPDRFSWVIDPAQGVRIDLTRGLTLIGFNEGEAPVKLAHKDTCGYEAEERDPEAGLNRSFGTEMADHRARYGAMAIVAHSSAVCYGTDPKLELLFSGTPFTQWEGLTYDQPYVAILSGDGQAREFLGPPGQSLGLDVTDFIRSSQIVQRPSQTLPRVLTIGAGGATGPAFLDAVADGARDFDLLAITATRGADGQLTCADGPARDPDTGDSCAWDALADRLGWNQTVRLVLTIPDGTPADHAALLAAHPRLAGRIIPTFRQPQDFLSLRNLGFNDLIWDLRGTAIDPAEAVLQLKDMDLLGLVVDQDLADAGLLRAARAKTGVLGWVAQATSADAADRALEAGAAEVFTDRLTPLPLVRFAAVSAGFGAGSSKVIGTENSLTLERGSNLLGLTATGAPVLLARFDGCAEDPADPLADPAALRAALETRRGDFAAVAVVVVDSAFCGEIDLPTLFAGFPLAGWPDVQFRQPYVGLLRPDGRTLEFTGDPETLIRHTLPVELPDG